MIILEAFHMHMYLHLYAHFIVRLYIFYKLIKTFIHIKDHFFLLKKTYQGHFVFVFVRQLKIILQEYI